MLRTLVIPHYGPVCDVSEMGLFDSGAYFKGLEKNIVHVHILNEVRNRGEQNFRIHLRLNLSTISNLTLENLTHKLIQCQCVHYLFCQCCL